MTEFDDFIRDLIVTDDGFVSDVLSYALKETYERKGKAYTSNPNISDCKNTKTSDGLFACIIQSTKFDEATRKIDHDIIRIYDEEVRKAFNQIKSNVHNNKDLDEFFEGKDFFI